MSSKDKNGIELKEGDYVRIVVPVTAVREDEVDVFVAGATIHVLSKNCEAVVYDHGKFPAGNGRVGLMASFTADDIRNQPVWVTFDPVACGVILRREIEAKIDPKVWQMFGINQGFKEDKWPSMVDGVATEPTFDWIGMVTGRRRSDETCFYSRVRIPRRDIRSLRRGDRAWANGDADKIELNHLMSTIQKSIDFFNSFSECECKVGKPCEHHALLGHTGDPDTGESNGSS